MKPFGEKNLDLLQNIEFGIVAVYREDSSLLDLDVVEALDALSRHYHAEEAGRRPSPPRLSPRAAKVFEQVKEMCEWRLGRPALDGGLPEPGAHPLPVSAVVSALREVGKSVARWSKQGGRKGYLEFVKDYIR